MLRIVLFLHRVLPHSKLVTSTTTSPIFPIKVKMSLREIQESMLKGAIELGAFVVVSDEEEDYQPKRAKPKRAKMSSPVPSSPVTPSAPRKARPSRKMRPKSNKKPRSFADKILDIVAQNLAIGSRAEDIVSTLQNVLSKDQLIAVRQKAAAMREGPHY